MRARSPCGRAPEIGVPQPAVDHRLKGRSSWLAVAREKSGLEATDKVSGKVTA